MLKYLTFCLLLALPLSARSEVINYVTPSQQDLGTVSDPQVKNIVIEDDFLSDLDIIAANHGDDHAMGTLANSCLSKKDYSCAYKWSALALKGSYWKQTGAESKIESIKNAASEHLTADEISELNEIINKFRPK